MIDRERKNIKKYKTADRSTVYGPLLNTLENEAHVYVAFTERYSEQRLLIWYRNLLSEEERERHKSFYFDRDRNLFLLTHALVRLTLSRYCDIAPDKWVFTHSYHGRPEIVQSNGNPQLRFNISHTDGMVACLIALSIDAGIDVEKVRELDNLKPFSESIFTPLELSNLQDLPWHDRMEGFFTLWTLKEAYVKARGMGLALALNRFTFHRDDTSCFRISFDAEVQDIPSNWQFVSFHPKPLYSLAIALRRGDRANLRIRFFEAIPELNDVSSLSATEYPLRNLNSFTTISS